MGSAKLGYPVKAQHVPDRSAEWPQYRDYQRENREKRLEHLRMINDLYTSYLY